MDFTIGLPIILKLSPKTRKINFWKVSFKIKFANFDLWFFSTQKYGSTALEKIFYLPFGAHGIVQYTVLFWPWGWWDPGRMSLSDFWNA